MVETKQKWNENKQNMLTKLFSYRPKVLILINIFNSARMHKIYQK